MGHYNKFNILALIGLLAGSNLSGAWYNNIKLDASNPSHIFGLGMSVCAGLFVCYLSAIDKVEQRQEKCNALLRVDSSKKQPDDLDQPGSPGGQCPKSSLSLVRRCSGNNEGDFRIRFMDFPKLLDANDELVNARVSKKFLGIGCLFAFFATFITAALRAR